MKLSSLDKYQLLVIEDDIVTRSLLRRMLHQIGFSFVSEAADGEAGYTEIMIRRPHLVLCDVHMEPVDGFELVRRVRDFRLGSVRDTPIIMLTADAHEETVMTAKDLQVQGYITKPVNFEMLRDRVESVLGG